MVDISMEQFEAFKSFYPDLDLSYSNVSLLRAKPLLSSRSTDGDQAVDWNSVVPADFSPMAQNGLFTPCQLAVAAVIFDVIAISIGAAGLARTLRPVTVTAMAEAAAPVLSQVETIIAEIGHDGASIGAKAYGFVRILKIVFNGGNRKLIWKAFKGNLTWHDAVIYGVAGLATIIAAIATDGLALAAEIVLLLVGAAKTAEDLATAFKVCGKQAVTPPPTPAFTSGAMPFKPSIAIRTASGNYLTIMKNGGLARPDGTSVMATDRRQVGPWEQFDLVPVDLNRKTFALRTHSGHYFSATRGGGFGGPDDASSPIHTDQTQILACEKLVLIRQTNQTYAICTTRGYYLTALGGGGRGGPNDASSIIHTDATNLSKDETFTFVPIEH